MSDKGSFIIYHTHEELIDLLDAQQTKDLLKAIFAYEKRGEDPDLDGVSMMAFTAIRIDLDRNRAKWEQTKEARSKAGKSSAEARRKKAEDNKTQQNKQNEQNEHVLNVFNKMSKAEQNEQSETNLTNATVDVDVDVDVDDKDKDKNIVQKAGAFEPLTNGTASTCATDPCHDDPASKKATKLAEAKKLFEQVWLLYPQKRGKGSVSDAQKLRLQKVGYEELARAIERYKRDVASADFDLQYKHGSTFFNSGYVDYLDANYTEPESRPVKARAVKPLSNRFSSGDVRDFSHLEE